MFIMDRDNFIFRYQNFINNECENIKIPISNTCKELEGDAVLIDHQEYSDCFECEFWKVKFTGEKEMYWRYINRAIH